MNEKIYVLHIVGRMSIGGVQKFLMNYYKHINQSILQFSFAVQRYDDMPYDSEIIALGGRVHKLPIMEQHPFHYIKELRKLILSHPEYKIVHVHLNRRNIIPLITALSCGVKVRISHSHNYGVHSSLIKKLQVLIIKKGISLFSTSLFACSKIAATYLYGENKVSKGKVKIIKNAIDAKKYTFDKNKRNFVRETFKLGDKKVYGHIGNFSEQKNYFKLIDIFSEIVKKDSGSMLMLIGDGPLKKQIEKYVHSKAITENLLFLGIRNDICDLMQAMDAFIFPSLFEGLGIVAIEAQAAGLPTFVSDKVPCEVDITELVEHIPLTASAEEWANTIVKKSKINRVRQVENIVCAGFDIENNAKMLEDFYIKSLLILGGNGHDDR